MRLNQKAIKAIQVAMFLVPFVFYLVLVIPANLDLALGRFALFMDERITFDGVRAILQPQSFESFLYAVSDGGDNRYGRILWTSMAAFSWIPELLFGEPGQIIAGRIWQVVLLISTVLIISFGIIRTWSMRIIFAAAALFLPFSAYYSTMPKPEPLQVFFIALFAFFAFRNEAKLLGTHWIFLGLAFGAKIATLPALVVFMFFALAFSKQKNKAASFHLSALAGVAGLGLAVPLLLPAAILVVLVGWGYLTLDKNKTFKLLNFAVVNVATVTVAFLIFKSATDVWIQSTFMATGHGADQDSINFGSWFGYLVQEWLSDNAFLSITLLVVMFVVFLQPLVKFENGFKNLVELNLPAISIFAAGTGLNFAIMISAQRLWGFYLYPGFMLQVLGVILLAETLFRKNKEQGQRLFSVSNLLPGITTGFIFLLVLSSWAPRALSEFQEAATRTSTPDFLIQNDSYLQLEDFMDEFGTNADRRLTAVISPTIFHRETDEKFDVIEFWGPYSYWDSATDLLILSKGNLPGSTPYPVDSPEYERYLLEQEGYPKHVTANGECAQAPCYVNSLTLKNGAQVLVRTK